MHTWYGADLTAGGPGGKLSGSSMSTSSSLPVASFPGSESGVFKLDEEGEELSDPLLFSDDASREEEAQCREKQNTHK